MGVYEVFLHQRRQHPALIQHSVRQLPHPAASSTVRLYRYYRYTARYLKTSDKSSGPASDRERSYTVPVLLLLAAIEQQLLYTHACKSGVLVITRSSTEQHSYCTSKYWLPTAARPLPTGSLRNTPILIFTSFAFPLGLLRFRSA